MVKVYITTTVRNPVKAEAGVVGIILETEIKNELHTLTDFKKVCANKETAELIALNLALSHLTRPVDIYLYSETDTAAERLLSGMLEKWKEAGWKNTRGKEIKHSDEWDKLLGLYEKNVISLSFEKTPHHSYTRWMLEKIEKEKMNEELNECSDESGASSQSSKEPEKRPG